MPGKGLLSRLSPSNRRAAAEHERARELTENYPTIGTCPVNERQQGAPGELGPSVGRCEFALYGGICNRHGDLRPFLSKRVDGHTFELIEESWLPERGQRDFGPDGLFTLPRIHGDQ